MSRKFVESSPAAALYLSPAPQNRAYRLGMAAIPQVLEFPPPLRCFVLAVDTIKTSEKHPVRGMGCVNVRVCIFRGRDHLPVLSQSCLKNWSKDYVLSTSCLAFT